MFKCKNMMRTRTFIITTVIYASVSAKSSYPVPTIMPSTTPTYPMPTSYWAIPTPIIPSRPKPSSSALLTSTPVRCLRKRDTGTSRVPLDSAMLRELYLDIVGAWDTKFQGETEEQLPHILHSYNIKQENATVIESYIPKSVIRKDLETIRTWMADVMANLSNNISDLRIGNSQLLIDDVLNSTNITEQELKHVLGLKSEMDIVKHLIPVTRRRKRNAEGSTSLVNYCHRRGAAAGNGFMHMCTECSMTTRTANDKFPRYINEVTCNSSDCYCFSTNGTEHGRCVPRVQSVKMLQRKAGGCRLVLHEGQQVIIDDWEVYNRVIHTGCECVFNRNSGFAPFVQHT